MTANIPKIDVRLEELNAEVIISNAELDENISSIAETSMPCSIAIDFSIAIPIKMTAVLKRRNTQAIERQIYSALERKSLWNSNASKFFILTQPLDKEIFNVVRRGNDRIYGNVGFNEYGVYLRRIDRVGNEI